VLSLEGIRALSVAAGVAHMLVLVDAAAGDKLAALPAWSPPPDVLAEAGGEGEAKKRKAPGAAAAGGKKRG